MLLLLRACSGGLPKLRLDGTPQEIVDAWKQLRRDFIAESQRLYNNPDKIRVLTAGCAQCRHFQLKDSVSDGKIRFVNLSMYPSICQSKCIYCTFDTNQSHASFESTEVKEAYQKLFDVLRLLDEEKMIHPNARFQVSSGEITVHPFRTRIYELLENKHVIFFSNCFKYDERIAAHLTRDPQSAINFSIDAGTPETWYKVKGVDNFDQILNNLRCYRNASTSPHQIILKYIMMSGINDSEEDFAGAISIMKELGVKVLIVSRDVTGVYEPNKQLTLDSVVCLFYMCWQNGLRVSLQTNYTDEERAYIKTAVSNLLQA